MENDPDLISEDSLSLIDFDNNQMISDEDDNFDVEEEENDESFIDLNNNFGAFDDSNIEDIKNMSQFKKMNDSMRSRKLNNSKEKSFRRNNKNNMNKTESTNNNLNVLVNKKSEKITYSSLEENIQDQKIIEINEDEDEKSFKNSDEEMIVNHQQGNPLKKFEEMYIKTKNENPDMNKITNEDMKIKNMNFKKKTNIENEIKDIKVDSFENNKKKIYFNKIDFEINYNDENEIVEEIFNNFDNEKEEKILTSEDINKMDKDELIKMILNSEMIINENMGNDEFTQKKSQKKTYNNTKSIYEEENKLQTHMNNNNTNNNESRRKIDDVANKYEGVVINQEINDLELDIENNNNKCKNENIPKEKNKFSFNPRKKNEKNLEININLQETNNKDMFSPKNAKYIINQNKKIENKNLNNLNHEKINKKIKSRDNQKLSSRKNHESNNKSEKIYPEIELKNPEEKDIILSNYKKAPDLETMNINNIMDIEKNDELDSEEILQMLLYNKNQIENEINSYGEYKIDEKVKKWLDKKTKNLEIIQEKIDEEYLKTCTFAPNVNNNNKKNRRNLEEFLNDQQEYQKRLATKKQDMQYIKEMEELKGNQNGPKINEISKKMMEEKLNNKDPVYERLYNLRTSKEEKGLQKVKNRSQEKNRKNIKIKDFEKKGKENVNDINEENDQLENPYRILNTDDNLKKKRNQSANINTINNIKQNKQKKSDIVNEESKKGNLPENKRKINSIRESQEITTNFKNPLDNSNKFLFNKFTFQYRNKFEELFTEFINNGFEFDYIKGVNLDFLLQFIFRLKFFDLDQIITNDNHSEKYLSNEELDNVVKQHEKNCLLEIFESIRDSEGNVSIDHFYIFCLGILDLLDYYILKAYSDKEKENDKELKGGKSQTPTNKNESKNVVIDKNVIEKINCELKSKIILNKKYGGYDENNNYIITFDQSKKIHKDFLCFSSNWYKSIRNTKNKVKEINDLCAESETFKPKINPKSAKIGDEYRKKIISEIDNEIKDKNQKLVTNNLDYIEILNLKKKKQEKLNQKLKEEKARESMKDCTFKPKINNYRKDNIYQVDNNTVERFDLLHKLGTQSIIQKKNKTTQDFDEEKFGDECTFKPAINPESTSKFQQKNDLFNEKELEKFNERMKRGRIEKESKDSALKRGEVIFSPNQMKFQEVNQIKINKSEEKIKKTPENIRNLNTDISKENYFGDQFVMNSCIMPKTAVNKNSIPVFENSLNTKSQINPNKNLLQKKLDFNYNNEKERTNHENLIRDLQKNNNKVLFSDDRKPILIIDVKLKEGILKNIRVYEGDSAEQLSNDFADENRLDDKMRGKLKKLVQNEINKLMHKIQEETNSLKNTMNEK